jgi:hypothetical protein
MTRETLEADRKDLQEKYQKTIADANAIKGALQYIDLKLAELDEPSRIVLPQLSVKG